MVDWVCGWRGESVEEEEGMWIGGRWVRRGVVSVVVVGDIVGEVMGLRVLVDEWDERL